MNIQRMLLSGLLLFSLYGRAQESRTGDAAGAPSAKPSRFEVGADQDLAEDYLSNSPSAIQARIRADVEEKCDKLGCTIASTHRVDKGWTFGLNVGHGNNNGSGTIYVIGGAQQTTDSDYVGVSVTYKNMTCDSELKLEKEWFMTLKSYGAYARSKNPADYNEPVSVAKPDTKFFALVYAEMIKQLSQAGCSR